MGAVPTLPPSSLPMPPEKKGEEGEWSKATNRQCGRMGRGRKIGMGGRRIRRRRKFTSPSKRKEEGILLCIISEKGRERKRCSTFFVLFAGEKRGEKIKNNNGRRCGIMRGACFAFFSRSIPSSSSVLVPLVKASLASSSSSFLPLLPLEKNRKRLYFTAAREKQTPFGWRERKKVSFAISFLFPLFSPLLSPAAAPSLPLYTFFTKPPPRQKEEEEEKKVFRFYS